jgi:hypothetical protein
VARVNTYAVPTAIANNDRLGTLSWAGQWGTTVGNLGTEDANFYAYATEAFTTSARGTGFGFDTITPGTTTLVNRLLLNSSSATFTVPVISGGNYVRVTTSQSPASNGTGTAGDIAWDTSYLYICTATDTWKRVALTGGY